jgi:hypothetical protein
VHVAARARLAAGIAALAALLWLLVGRGLANYDTLYSLVWGRELGHGHLPDYTLPIAPTPHPLQTLAAAVLTPLSSASSGGRHGQAAVTVVIVGAFVALAILGWLVYRLGAEWFHPAVGVAAAAIMLTRRPVLDFGARCYVDMPYLCLVLGALLVETRRRRAGAPVLALLALAGLIRPEAWLFSAAYLVWLWAGGERDWRLVILAASAPVLWALSDLAVTGDPLHSLTGTRDTAQTLQRVTGLQHVPTTVPRRIGEILREPGLLAAAGGGILALWWLRARAGLGAAVGVLSIVAFSILATAGLPILGRYLLLPAAILAVFAGAGLLGWLALPPGDARRRWWQAFAVVAALAFVVFGPSQEQRISELRSALRIQAGIQDDLGSLVRGGALSAPCGGVAVPNHRPVPLLALWLDRDPADITDTPPRQGVYVAPATRQVAKDYILDPRDPVQRVARAPAGFRRTAANASWIVSQRCPRG